eukprot:1313654-Rhodomonas_salina.3
MASASASPLARSAPHEDDALQHIVMCCDGRRTRGDQVLVKQEGGSGHAGRCAEREMPARSSERSAPRRCTRISAYNIQCTCGMHQQRKHGEQGRMRRESAESRHGVL